MPKGIEVFVEDGFAEIDFVDPKLRGPGLGALEAVAPGIVQKLSREKGAPRNRYRVPEGNAREAGLLDDHNDVAALEAVDVTSGLNADGSQPEVWTSGDAHSQTKRSGVYADAYGGADDPTPITVEGTSPAVSVAVGAAHVTTDTVPVRTEATIAAQTGARVPVEGTEAFQAAVIGLKSSGQLSAEEIAEATEAKVAEEREYPEGDPEEGWLRPELNAYAEAVGVEDADKLPNKPAVLEAIGDKRVGA